MIVLRAAATAVAMVGAAACGLEARVFDVPPGDLAPEFESLAKETGLELIVQPSELKRIHTQGVTGTLSREDTVARLESATRLSVEMHQGAMLTSSTEGGGESHYTGSAFTDYSRLSDGSFDPAHEMQVVRLLNLRTGVRSHAWEFALSGTNLLNRTVRQSLDPWAIITIPVPARPRYVVTRPRTTRHINFEPKGEPREEVSPRAALKLCGRALSRSE
jgi:hypothetical protein